ncbi:FHA domain-containing protein [Tumebacillus permanentifrigoris]|uniref:Transcriptional regulator n=1 Tax=Tumebacillus permanentifrigoris TaxID=378543 RepID=A0A316DAJ1_9BACL|nr:FHA domain-containing protein [Tumebacillus permanentifrigoris]PWK13832.1 transcriptional regulator [Tumebacillus permanentifrigoris]
MVPFACLYVEKGEPYHAGSCLLLDTEETVIGRTSQQAVPEVAFLNAFVSRRHLLIRNVEGKAVLYDLGSKHGTHIGGTPLEPHTPYELQDSDVIRLAGGMVSLRFSYQVTEMTLELDIHSLQTVNLGDLRIDREKRVAYVEGDVITMSDKEWRLFLMLYDQAGTLVTFEAVKRAVWSERSTADDGLPDVGNDELSSLVYRIRKKLHESRYTIQTVRGTGFVFEPRE